MLQLALAFLPQPMALVLNPKGLLQLTLPLDDVQPQHLVLNLSHRITQPRAAQHQLAAVGLAVLQAAGQCQLPGDLGLLLQQDRQLGRQYRPDSNLSRHGRHRRPSSVPRTNRHGLLRICSEQSGFYP